MPDIQKKPSPPYATFSSFLNFINRLRDAGMPNRIDRSVFGNTSGSIVYSTIASLKSLGLIEDNGRPTPQFNELVCASDEKRPELLRKIVMEGYPSLFNGGIDLSKMTAGQFNEHIREEFDVAGSTIDKIAAFFLAAAKAAKIPVSKHLETRAPIAASASSKKSERQRKKLASRSPASAVEHAPMRKHEPNPEKALEYRLVDLMADAAGNPEVMDAIITVITFLKTREAAQPPSKETDNGVEEEF